MDCSVFDSRFSEIKALDETEGPPRNILEPKFEARKVAQILVRELEDLFAQSPSVEALRQLCQLAAFLGQNFYDTDEDAEAEASHGRSFALALACLKRDVRSDLLREIRAKESTNLQDALIFQPTELSEEADWTGSGSVMIVALNAIGVFLSSRSKVSERVDDARKVLLAADACYHQTRKFVDHDIQLERLHTSTYFFLAQTYTFLGMTSEASRYCHITMVYQMRYNLDFSRKVWATNAVHLAGYYAAEGLYGEGLHCLEAARIIMPSTPADEETLGVVAWGFGKFYKVLLRRSAEHKDDTNAPAPRGPSRDHLQIHQWWLDFPVESVESPREISLVDNFSDARDLFRKAVLELQKAAEYYTFETCCPDHIAIYQDIAECYKALSTFEEDIERRAAMLQRRIDAVSRFPEQLSFTAYATLIRQLYFDLGDMASDLFDLRLSQKQSMNSKTDGAQNTKPLSDKKLNELGRNARNYFVKFLNSFCCDSPTSKFITTDMDCSILKKCVESELRIPIFRALMRIARLDSKILCKNPQDEYVVLRDAIQRYDDVLSFAEVNKLREESSIEMELKLAHEMKALLPVKQRDLMKAARS